VPVKQKAPLRDRIIPWYFVMGFMVVLTVNTVFVRTAIRSNPGVVTEHAYETGLAYNDVLKEVKAEKALGWHASLAYRDGQLRLDLQDRKKNRLTGAKVTAYIERPLQEGFRQTVELEQTGDAAYAAPVQFPLKGQWDITVSMVWNKQYYQIRQRLIVS